MPFTESRPRAVREHSARVKSAAPAVCSSLCSLDSTVTALAYTYVRVTRLFITLGLFGGELVREVGGERDGDTARKPCVALGRNAGKTEKEKEIRRGEKGRTSTKVEKRQRN